MGFTSTWRNAQWTKGQQCAMDTIENYRKVRVVGVINFGNKYS